MDSSKFVGTRWLWLNSVAHKQNKDINIRKEAVGRHERMKRGCSKEGVPTVVEAEVCNKYMLYTSIMYTVLNYIYMVCIKLSKRYWRDASVKNTCCSYKGSRLNSQNPYEGS